MATLTIRNVPDEVYRALKSLAAIHKRSMEAEVRAILEEHSLPKQRILLGNALWELRRNAGVTKADAEALEEKIKEIRSSKPHQPPRL